jgi:hypothetical protein
MARAELTTEWVKINITKNCAIQNTGQNVARIAILTADVIPTTKDFGFILFATDSIGIISSDIVYARSEGTIGVLEVA